MKHLKTIAIFIIAALIIAGGVWYILGYTGSQKNQTQGTDIVEHYNSVPQTACGLTVIEPLPSTKVSFPLSVSGIVNNTKAKELGCSWGVFEAVAGVIQVKDENGKVISSDTPFTTNNQNWMTDPSSVYTGTITLEEDYKGKATIHFTEDNSSGSDNPDTLDIPIIIK